jgi:membrane fusion protein, multidrug efflux system
LKLKATFPNRNQALWPGAFIRVTLNAGVSKNAIVLPPQSVIDGPDGHFVYIVLPTHEVAVKPVKLLRIQDQMAVVEGLKDGESVVREGNQSLIPGSKVRAASGNSKPTDDVDHTNKDKRVAS